MERAGATVSRDELKKLLWAPDTFVDFDHGLNTTVNKIREALSDSAENPRYIETLPNGYRFIATVNRPAASEEIERSIPSRPETEAARLKRWPQRSVVAAVAAICVIVSGLLAFQYRDGIFPRHPPNIKSIAVLPLRNLSGDPAQDYFSDSMTDELTTQLAKISSLRVAFGCLGDALQEYETRPSQTLAAISRLTRSSKAAFCALATRSASPPN